MALYKNLTTQMIHSHKCDHQLEKNFENNVYLSSPLLVLIRTNELVFANQSWHKSFSMITTNVNRLITHKCFIFFYESQCEKRTPKNYAFIRNTWRYDWRYFCFLLFLLLQLKQLIVSGFFGL